MTTAYLLLVTVLTVTLFVGPGLGDDGVIQGQKPEYDESETYFDGVEGEDELISSDDLTIESANSRSIPCPQTKWCMEKGGHCTPGMIPCIFGEVNARCTKGCVCCKKPAGGEMHKFT
ncbi:unnamed protein product [Meganyctiphanes norvegica]|uniref:Uncharacterized protein n=1 Tax=Meganyctiphanes norvegica TaxID=48144 RepID=A0AAV2QWJ3_MEGNR